MFAGVCGGLGEYFNIDVSVIRIVWALLALFTLIGFVAYIVALLVIPER